MNDEIRALIADDDEGMRLVLRKMIEKAGGYALAGEAEDGEQLVALYERFKPELVILDVEMPKLSGVECAKRIQDIDPKTVLIFATAHAEYMKDAFEYYAFDFLLKPFKTERALKTLALVRDRLRGEPGVRVDATPLSDAALPPPRPSAPLADRMMVKGREGMSFVDLDKLLLIQREDRQTALYAEGDIRLTSSETLSELEARLPPQFFRAHKSYIVNINHIESITPYGRWTYNVQLRGTRHDALITHERFEALQKLFV